MQDVHYQWKNIWDNPATKCRSIGKRTYFDKIDLKYEINAQTSGEKDPMHSVICGVPERYSTVYQLNAYSCETAHVLINVCLLWL